MVTYWLKGKTIKVLWDFKGAVPHMAKGEIRPMSQGMKYAACSRLELEKFCLQGECSSHWANRVRHTSFSEIEKKLQKITGLYGEINLSVIIFYFIVYIDIIF